MSAASQTGSRSNSTHATEGDIDFDISPLSNYQQKGKDKSQLIAEGPGIVRNAYAENGITGTPNASFSFSELKEAAAMEKDGEAMGWKVPGR